MDTARSQQLKDIIDLSRQMLALADDNQWGKVAELEAQRRQLVMDCFRHPTPDRDAAEVAAVIREVLQLNQQVTERGQRLQDELGSQMQARRIGRTAQQAYQECAGRSV